MLHAGPQLHVYSEDTPCISAPEKGSWRSFRIRGAKLQECWTNNTATAEGMQSNPILPLAHASKYISLHVIQYSKVLFSQKVGGSHTNTQLRQACHLQEIAETKLPDLNAVKIEAAMNIVAGTAKNMGIKIAEE